MESYEQHFQLAKHFLVPSAAARWRTCASFKSEKQLNSALMLIEHGTRLDKKKAVLISKSERNSVFVVQRLKSLGAPNECFVLSNCGQLNGQKFSLEEGVQAALDTAFGTLVSCVAGRLGFYCGEFLDDCYLLFTE